LPSLRCIEHMRGYVTFGEPSFELGYERGQASDTDLMFRLAIEVNDVEALIDDPQRPADARGYVRCEALGGRFTVERGTFQLLVPAGGEEGKRMLYRLQFADGTGHPLTLTGFKRLQNGPVTRLWPETTTLYTRLLQGHADEAGERDAELIASGILRLAPLDFLRQLTTFRAGGASARERLLTVVRFDSLFVRELARLYGPTRG
jgi:cholesterol oxidase